MIISIASGKGGTGKTTVACGLASVINNSVYIDCDVEEPNGYLLLKPEIKSEEKTYKLIPKINYSRCDFCNKCSEVCEFNALLNLKTEIYLLDELCHSCGACAYFCPQQAITEEKKGTGKQRTGVTANDVLFLDAFLRIGEASAAPLIKQVKNFYKGNRTVIIDSPPGTSCSMFEAVKDSDFCVLVTESTPFGLNDLKLAINVLRQINIPFGIVINKYDEQYYQLDEYILDNKINLLLKIPFSMAIAESYSKGELPAATIKEYKQIMLNLFDKVKTEISETEYA
ncbi:MAG TPA: ATP-binding protein [Ignavibacteriaceae bacterium]|nr:ATP-binding protein [Ignavibacteriaceae bacterium]